MTQPLIEPPLTPTGAAPVASLGAATALADLPLVASGKVRDMYDRLLMVASDRISAYDVVHPTAIPDKGKVLSGLSVFWFEQTGAIVPNHLPSITDDVPDDVRGRAIVVRKLEMLPVECVVRGYLTGSGWKHYQATGSVAGIALPDGLRESAQLPEAIFTPSTKAEVGHDEDDVDVENKHAQRRLSSSTPSSRNSWIARLELRSRPGRGPLPPRKTGSSTSSGRSSRIRSRSSTRPAATTRHQTY